MTLSTAEKSAGRTFRDTQQLLLDGNNHRSPPTFAIPQVIANLRHLCPARNGRSTTLECKEIYIASPIYPEHGVEAGRFAFLYREGRCRGCGQTARSGTGRLVDGRHRPPLSGRVTRS